MNFMGVVMKTSEAGFTKTNVASFTNAARFSKAAWMILTACALSACVTINIYFPAAAVEKAADKIIDEVWKTQHTDKSASPAVKDAK
jgi:hypothetical protein